MKRFLSHSVIVDDRVINGLILTVIDDEGNATLTPFTHETEATVYVDGPLDLSSLHPKTVKIHDRSLQSKTVKIHDRSLQSKTVKTTRP